MRRTRAVFFVLSLFAASCGNISVAPPLYDEEAVLRVWDVLDEHYGSGALFECELHTVRSGQIRIAKPYDISRIAVVGYPSADDMPVLFRLVPSDPGENEFVIKGATLSFHKSYEGQKLFVAWVPQSCRAASLQPPGGRRRQ